VGIIDEPSCLRSCIQAWLGLCKEQHQLDHQTVWLTDEVLLVDGVHVVAKVLK
jgi:hypothetical protein